MKGYIPVAPGWYAVPIASTDDEFNHKISDDPDTMIDMSDNTYMYTRVRIMAHSGVSIYDVYYHGKREAEDCMSFGGGIGLWHKVEFYKVDWDTLPDWMNYVTIDADGTIKGHNNKPEQFATKWGAPSMPALRFKHKHDYIRIDGTYGIIEIPLGIDWRMLIEERPKS